MNITVRVSIHASPAQAWEVFKDVSAWAAWYGVPMDSADWQPGGSLHYPEHDGILAGTIPISEYKENESCTFAEHWTTTVHAVAPLPDGGCEFTKIITPQNGANYTADGYPREVAKQQEILNKFKALVEERFAAPAQAPVEPVAAAPVVAPAETPAETPAEGAPEAPAEAAPEAPAEAPAEETPEAPAESAPEAPAAVHEEAPAQEAPAQEAPAGRNVFTVFAVQGPAFGQAEGDIVQEKANAMRDDYAPAKEMEFELVRPGQWAGRVEAQNIGGMIQTSIRLDSFKAAITQYLSGKGIPREIIDRGIAESDENSLLLTNPFSGVTVIGVPLRGLPVEEKPAPAPVPQPAAGPAFTPPGAVVPAPTAPGAQAPKKKNRKLLWILLAVAAVVVIGVGVMVGVNVYKAQRYEKAMTYYEQGDYTGAASIFRSLGNYQMAEKYAENAENAAKFDQAQTLMNWGRYEEAKAIFDELGSFNGAKALAEECGKEIDYQKAEDLMEEGKYDEAAALYERLGMEDLARDAWHAEYYRQGVEYFEQGDYELARQSFEKATESGDYKDSDEYLGKLKAMGLAETIQAMIAGGDFNSAMALLTDSEDLAEYIEGYDELRQKAEEGLAAQEAEERQKKQAEQLAQAKEAYEKGEYYTAYKLYSGITGNEEAAKLAQQCIQAKPSTGETYHNADYTAFGCELTIQPPDDGTCTYFKIYSADNEDVLICSVFINAGDNYTVSLPAGSYIFKSAYSKGEWWGEKEMFGDGSDAHYQRLKNGSTDVFELEYNNAYSLTLRSASNGNVGNRSEDPGSF